MCVPRERCNRFRSCQDEAGALGWVNVPIEDSAACRERTRLIPMGTIILRVFVLAALCVCANAKTPIFLSTDVGNEVDDQWAIVYLLTNPAFETLGISSAHAPTLPSPSA